MFPGNDLPGIWLGRGAARMAGVHGVRPGDHAVVIAGTEESLEHLVTLQAIGVRVVAVAAPAGLAERIPSGAGELVIDGMVHEAIGGNAIRGVVLRRGAHRKRFACDTLVLSLGLAPRDTLRTDGPPRRGPVGAGRRRGDVRPPTTPSNGDDGHAVSLRGRVLHDLEQAWDEGYATPRS